MPNVAIYNISGAKVGEMELSENIFGQELNVPAEYPFSVYRRYAPHPP